MSNSKWTLQVLEEIMVLRLLVQINRMVPQCYNVAVSCVARTHVPQLDHNHQRHQYHLCRSFGPSRLMMGCNYALDGFGRHSYPMCMNAATYLRHSSPVNALVLGEACASEESDFVFPSDDFSSRALVPSHQKVSLLVALFFFFFYDALVKFEFYFTVESSVLGHVQKIHWGPRWLLVWYCITVLLEGEVGQASIIWESWCEKRRCQDWGLSLFHKLAFSLSF